MSDPLLDLLVEHLDPVSYGEAAKLLKTERKAHSDQLRHMNSDWTEKVVERDGELLAQLMEIHKSMSESSRVLAARDRK